MHEEGQLIVLLLARLVTVSHHYRFQCEKRVKEKHEAMAVVCTVLSVTVFTFLAKLWQKHWWKSTESTMLCGCGHSCTALHCTLVHSCKYLSYVFFFFFLNFKVTFSPEIKFLVPTTSFWKCYNNLRKLLFRRKIKDYMDLWRETRIRLPKCCRLGVYSNESNMKGIMAMSTEKWYSMMVYCIQGERFVKVWGI